MKEYKIICLFQIIIVAWNRGKNTIRYNVFISSILELRGILKKFYLDSLQCSSECPIVPHTKGCARKDVPGVVDKGLFSGRWSPLQNFTA